VVETVRKLEIRPKDVTELLQFHDKIWVNEELLLIDEQRKCLLEMNTAGMIMKDSEYNRVWKD
jgi:hypothetical protein